MGLKLKSTQGSHEHEKMFCGLQIKGKVPCGPQFIEEGSEATYLVKYDAFSSFN